MPVGPLLCVIDGPTRGRPWSAAAVRGEFRRHAVEAGVRRRFAPHQLGHAHAVELAREGISLNVIQRQLGHANLGTTSIYLQGIDIGRGSDSAERLLKSSLRRLADEPDCSVAHLDRESLQRAGTGGSLHGTGEGLERALGTPHHFSGADVVQCRVGWALQASVLGHVSLAQRGEQVAAPVGDGERLARTDADGEGAVRCLLYHGDLGATEILDGD